MLSITSFSGILIVEKLEKEQDVFSLPAYPIIKNTETVYIILEE